MAKLTPWLTQKFYAADGVTPLSGGKVFTYEENSTTKKASYTTQAGDVENTNPVILNANGEPSSGIWMDSDSYKFVVTTADDTDPPTSPISTYDYVSKPSDEYVHYVSTYAELVAKLAALGSDEATVSIVGTITLNGNIIIPNTIALRIERDGYIIEAFSFTINGVVVAGQHQVFDDTTTVVFGDTAQTVEAMWFGGDTNKSTDGTTAIDGAMAAMSSGGTLRIPFGYVWDYNSLVTHTDFVKIIDESGYNYDTGDTARWSNFQKVFIKEPDYTAGPPTNGVSTNDSGHFRFHDSYYPIVYIMNVGSQLGASGATEYPAGILIGRRVAGDWKGAIRIDGNQRSTADLYDMTMSILTATVPNVQHDFAVCRADDHVFSAYNENSGGNITCFRVLNPYAVAGTSAALEFSSKVSGQGLYTSTAYARLRHIVVGVSPTGYSADFVIEIQAGNNGTYNIAAVFKADVPTGTHFLGLEETEPTERLHISGNLRVDNGGILIDSGGTLGLPSNIHMTFTSGTTTIRSNVIMEDTNYIGQAAGAQLQWTDSINLVTLSGGSLVIDTSRFIQFAPSGSASAGDIRLYNGATIEARNNADNGDIEALTVNASDELHLHDSDVVIKSDGLLNAVKGFGGTPDLITADNAGTAASVETLVTEITTDGDSNEDNVTLANGYSGQVKKFAVSVVGNAADSLKITPTTMVGGSKISFGANPIGLGCEMVYTAAGWCVISNNGGTVS